MKHKQNKKKRSWFPIKSFRRKADSVKPQEYPQRPLSKKNAMLRPIKRS